MIVKTLLSVSNKLSFDVLRLGETPSFLIDKLFKINIFRNFAFIHKTHRYINFDIILTPNQLIYCMCQIYMKDKINSSGAPNRLWSVLDVIANFTRNN